MGDYNDIEARARTAADRLTAAGWKVTGHRKLLGGQDHPPSEIMLLGPDKLKIALVDDGSGGQTHFTTADPRATCLRRSDCEKLLLEASGCKSVDDLACAVEELTNRWLDAKACARKTLFRVRRGGQSVTCSLSAPFGPAVAAQLRAKYGKDLVEIVNETIGKRPKVADAGKGA